MKGVCGVPASAVAMNSCHSGAATPAPVAVPIGLLPHVVAQQPTGRVLRQWHGEVLAGLLVDQTLDAATARGADKESHEAVFSHEAPCIAATGFRKRDAASARARLLGGCAGHGADQGARQDRVDAWREHFRSSWECSWAGNANRAGH